MSYSSLFPSLVFTIQKFSDQYAADVVAVSVDVDDLDEVAGEAGVKAMPTFQVYRNGNKTDEMVGADSVKLEALFKN